MTQRDRPKQARQQLDAAWLACSVERSALGWQLPELGRVARSLHLLWSLN